MESWTSGVTACHQCLGTQRGTDMGHLSSLTLVTSVKEEHWLYSNICLFLFPFTSSNYCSSSLLSICSEMILQTFSQCFWELGGCSRDSTKRKGRFCSRIELCPPSWHFYFIIFWSFRWDLLPLLRSRMVAVLRLPEFCHDQPLRATLLASSDLLSLAFLLNDAED